VHMNQYVAPFNALNELFEDDPYQRILAVALFLDEIPIFVIPKLEVRHLGMFDDDFKFVYMKQVYHLNHLDPDMDVFLWDLFYENPSDPIFNEFGKRISIAYLKIFSKNVRYMLHKANSIRSRN